jgi:hypothetical protein
MKDKKRKGKKKPARDSVSQVVNVYVTRKQGQPKQKQPSAPLAPIPYMPRQGYTFEPLIKPAMAQVAPADNRLETLLRQMEERMKPIEVKAKQEAKQEAEPTREMIAETQSSSVGGESSGGPTASSTFRDRVADIVSKYTSARIASLTQGDARDIAQQLGRSITRKTKTEDARRQLSAIIEEKRAYYNLP